MNRKAVFEFLFSPRIKFPELRGIIIVKQVHIYDSFAN